MQAMNQWVRCFIVILLLGPLSHSGLAVDGPMIPNAPCINDPQQGQDAYICAIGHQLKVPLPALGTKANTVYYECGTRKGDCGPVMQLYGLHSDTSKSIYSCTAKKGETYWRDFGENPDNTMTFICSYK